MQTKARILGIDLLRSVAILGAMASHALTAADAFHWGDTAAMQLARLAMGLATPIFICLFGSMLEIVYRRQIATQGFEAVILKLLSRALQCYVLYVLALALHVAVGDFSAGYALRCALLIGVTPFSDILKFYAVILAVAPLILWLSRRRSGLVSLCIAGVALHLLHPWLPVISVPPGYLFGGNYLDFAAGFVYGGGKGPGGPSLLHGLTLVIYGMVLGRLALSLLKEVGRGRAWARLRLAGAAFVLSGVVASLWPWHAPLAEPVQALIEMTYRNGNDPIYFALGSLAATLLAWAFLEAYDVRRVRLGSGVAFIGSSSLFTFSFGNMILIAAPDLDLGPAQSLFYAIALLSAVFLLSWLFWASLKSGRTSLVEGGSGLPANWARLQAGTIGVLSLSVAGAAGVYGDILMTRDASSLRSRRRKS
ncbi:OpgC domain-containing protein [Brevundimonas variabilis]|uniref:Heparan-alpha-glucosaminide N-acetyltransferase catalytic domain-containing protein n=1 Tax=Brevundimonas variabilis TaxID=74312 RepID=A0A7W9FEY2_9CAUL|nr:OpgC domain-containing protein [Brevundimonas variabilis]MBB5744839.1 hypothetical protein [Brevundimonas variabilis]